MRGISHAQRNSDLFLRVGSSVPSPIHFGDGPVLTELSLKGFTRLASELPSVPGGEANVAWGEIVGSHLVRYSVTEPFYVGFFAEADDL